MDHDNLLPDAFLLSLCAILDWFTPPLLVGLGVESAALTRLLHSDRVRPHPTQTGTFQLDPVWRKRVLERLRARRPKAEVWLHRHALRHFLAKIGQEGALPDAGPDEAACLHHIDQLFELLRVREQWPQLARYVAEVAQVRLRQSRHKHRLRFYEGIVALNSNAIPHAVALFTTLLDDSELEQELRLRVLNALATAYLYQSQYDRALEYYDKTATLAREMGARYYQGASHINMGMAYQELQNYPQALLHTARGLYHLRLLGNQAYQIYALYEMGNCALHLGRWRSAERYFNKAAHLAQSLDLPARLAYIRWGQGLLYHCLGDATQSEAHYREGLRLAAKSSDRKELNDLWWYLGFLYHTEEDWDKAKRAYNKAIKLATKLGRPHTLSLILYRRGELFEQQGHLTKAEADYSAAIGLIEALRHAAGDEAVKIGLVGTTQQVYEAMVMLCYRQGRYEEAFNYVERARSRAFLDMLERKDPAFDGPPDNSTVTLAEVCETLPREALLLEYFTIGLLPRGDNMVTRLVTKAGKKSKLVSRLAHRPCTLLFAISREGCDVTLVDLDPNLLQPKPDDPDPIRSRFSSPSLLAALYDRLIQPVAHLIRPCRLLYLVPHGPLHYLPFSALHSATDGYLLDDAGPAIAFAPSATVLLRNCLKRSRSESAAFLALGYDGDGSGTGEKLSYAESEARCLAQLMGGRAETGAAPKSHYLLGTTHTLRWLHISSHGSYHAASPLDSALHLGQGDNLTAYTIIRELKTFQAELVTLSACASGVAQLDLGDELLGLPRAFLYAGAPRVVCALWKIPDRVALLVMVLFYRALRQGRGPAEALQAAQTSLRSLTWRSLQAMVASWQAENPAWVATLDLPQPPPDRLDAPLLTELVPKSYLWPPFVLIGRAD